jgi:hypothetical protein
MRGKSCGGIAPSTGRSNVVEVARLNLAEDLRWALLVSVAAYSAVRPNATQRCEEVRLLKSDATGVARASQEPCDTLLRLH